MLPLQAPAQARPAPEAPLPLAVAVARVLDQYDLGGDGAVLTAPAVALRDRPSLQWLLECLGRELPDNPFPKGGREWNRAETLRDLLRERGTQPALLQRKLLRQDLAEAGTQAALWRWGRRLARLGRLDRATRRLWEDMLLSAPVPTLATTYALRHALSLALAEGDAARFADLKAAHAADALDLMLGFQRLFGMIGTPGPKLHLWTLPGLAPVQVHLRELGAGKVWICPLDPAAAAPPAGVAWIVPSRSGSLPGAASSLDDADRAEGATAAMGLAPGARAWFAPSREDFEASGLTIFPILVELDGAGNVVALRVGEAAPASP